MEQTEKLKIIIWIKVTTVWALISFHNLPNVLEEDEDLTEPPVPPNVHSLSPALRNFIDFFEIDSDWLVVVAQTSSKTGKIDAKLSSSIDQLTESEKHDFLERLLNSEPHLDIALVNRLREITGTDKAEWSMSERRTIRQILAVSETIRQQRLEKKNNRRKLCA